MVHFHRSPEWVSSALDFIRASEDFITAKFSDEVNCHDEELKEPVDVTLEDMLEQLEEIDEEGDEELDSTESEETEDEGDDIYMDQ